MKQIHGKTNHDYGIQGEEYASSFLLEHGYYIRERNWRFHHYELDIICESPDRTELVFVEVKSRMKGCNEIEELITKNKMHFLRNAAIQYIEQKHYEGSIRFDLILVEGLGKSILQVKDVFTSLD